MEFLQDVQSAEDFCSNAQFGPITTKFVVDNIESQGGSVTEKTIKICAARSLSNLFTDLGVPTILREVRNKDAERYLNAWVKLRIKYDKLYLPIAAEREAALLVKNLFDDSAKPAQDPQRYARAEKAFCRAEKTDEKGGHASEGVMAILMNQHAQYSDEYIAPYSTIVGPSGIGKSFSVRQMAVRYGIYVAYSNLSSQGSTGFPRPVTMGEAPLDTKEYTVSDMAWETYLDNQVVLAHCCKAIDITAGGLFELLTRNKSEVVQLRIGLQKHFSTGKVDANALRHTLIAVKNVLEALGLNIQPTSPQIDKAQPVIVCFDEARALLDDVENSVFQSLRRAAREVVEGCKGTEKKDKVPFFIVLLDTTSRITNFTPPGQYDPCSKVLKADIFHPIFQINSFDLFSPPADSLEDPSGTENAVEQLFSHGRPLWGAFLEAGSSWDSLLNLAAGKISAQKDRLAYDLSLLTYRMNFYISSPVLAEAMVASSMRYLISVSTDRTSLVTTQPGEPVLALAASCLLQDPAVRLSCVRSWISGLHSGAVNPGDIGEQVASLIILFASDYASEPKRSLPEKDPANNNQKLNAIAPQAISLQSFLSALLGKETLQAIQSLDHSPATQDILNTGLVFLNHFIRLCTTPTRAVLEVAYKRGAALFLPTNFPGMDMAIPVRVPNGHMSVLLVQVMNRQDDSFTPGLKIYMKETLQKAETALQLTDELHGIVGLVLCMRTSADPYFAVISPAARQTARATRSQDSASTPAATATNTTTIKGKKKRNAKGKLEESITSAPEPAQLLGIAFGLNSAVYPCMRAPNAAALEKAVDHGGLSEMKVMNDLLVRLLEQWPNAYVEEDMQSCYAQKLLDPVSGLEEASRRNPSDTPMPDI